jgi:hypothetical protein
VSLLEADRGDLADLDPGDAHVVARLEATGLRQRRRVTPPAQQRELVGVEREKQHRRDDGQPDGADDDGVALTERGHH